LIDPRFLLKAKLENPTRMSLKGVTAYWKHWDSEGQKGNPFSFLDLDDSDNGKDKSDEGDDDVEDPPISPPNHFDIDDDIPYPFLCDTGGHTSCLQALVSTKGQINKTFHEVVKMVDSMEVSPILSI